MRTQVKQQAETAHRLEFERFRTSAQLTELQENMSQDLPGLDLGTALREKKELAAKVAELQPLVDALQQQVAQLESAGTEIDRVKADLRSAEEQLVASSKAKKAAVGRVEELEKRIENLEVDLKSARTAKVAPGLNLRILPHQSTLIMLLADCP